MKKCNDTFVDEGIEALPNNIKSFIYNSSLKIEIVGLIPNASKDCYGYIKLDKNLILIKKRRDKYSLIRTLFHKIGHYIDYSMAHEQYIFFSQIDKDFKTAWAIDKRAFNKLFKFKNAEGQLDNGYIDEPEAFAYIFAYYMLVKLHRTGKHKRNKNNIWLFAKKVQNKCPNLWREIDIFVKNYVIER